LDGSAFDILALYAGCTRRVNCLWDTKYQYKRDEPRNEKGKY